MPAGSGLSSMARESCQDEGQHRGPIAGGQTGTLTEKVTFKQRLEGSGNTNPANHLGKFSKVKRTPSTNAQREECVMLWDREETKAAW